MSLYVFDKCAYPVLASSYAQMSVGARGRIQGSMDRWRFRIDVRLLASGTNDSGGPSSGKLQFATRNSEFIITEHHRRLPIRYINISEGFSALTFFEVDYLPHLDTRSTKNSLSYDDSCLSQTLFCQLQKNSHIPEQEPTQLVPLHQTIDPLYSAANAKCAHWNITLSLHEHFHTLGPGTMYPCGSIVFVSQ